jgi:sulfur-oxidizing protein SoxY
MTPEQSATRREFLIGGASATLLNVVMIESAAATPEAMQAEIRKITGAAQVRIGKIILEIPQLVENGNTVPLSIKVESPMTAGDHVKAIHVFNEKNPQPHVISVALGPRAGRASVSTRIKLADTQNIVALAQMSDGSFWSGSANVIVTIAACLEDF